MNLPGQVKATVKVVMNLPNKTEYGGLVEELLVSREICSAE